ncbi:MAG: hypothetical protein ACTSRW_16980 [Candidatus Helarchaeota archaeon]
MGRSKTEAAESKLKTATGLAGLGGGIGSVFSPVGGAIGAGLGGMTGLIIGDDTTVFPIDMVAIPAYQAYLLQGNPALTVYIKAGETLVPTGGNVLDMQENMNIEAVSESMDAPKKRKRSKWNVYTSKKKNQIRFKSGKNKGLLNLKAMGKAYRKAQKGGKK